MTSAPNATSSVLLIAFSLPGTGQNEQQPNHNNGNSFFRLSSLNERTDYARDSNYHSHGAPSIKQPV